MSHLGDTTDCFPFGNNDHGQAEFVYTNDVSGRWVTVGSDIDLYDFGAGGNTRVVGLYDDPTVVSGEGFCS